MSATAPAESKRVYFKIDYEAGTKVCPRCMTSKPLDEFYAYRDGRYDGLVRYGSWCKPCQRKNQQRLGEKARKGVVLRRSNRFDHRGRIWCPNCKAYQERDLFKEHPNRPGKYWAYCTPCTRVLDRIRYRYGGAQRKKEAFEARRESRRHKRQLELAERRKFVMDAFDILRRRGFSQADIARLIRADAGNLRVWAEGRRNVGPAVAKTFAAALYATKDYRIKATAAPMKSTGRPHPDMARLIEVMEFSTRQIRRKGRKA